MRPMNSGTLVVYPDGHARLSAALYRHDLSIPNYVGVTVQGDCVELWPVWEDDPPPFPHVRRVVKEPRHVQVNVRGLGLPPGRYVVEDSVPGERVWLRPAHN